MKRWIDVIQAYLRLLNIQNMKRIAQDRYISLEQSLAESQVQQTNKVSIKSFNIWKDWLLAR